MSETV